MSDNALDALEGFEAALTKARERGRTHSWEVTATSRLTPAIRCRVCGAVERRRNASDVLEPTRGCELSCDEVFARSVFDE